MNSIPSKGIVLLAGNSHPEFAMLIAKHLGLDMGKCSVYFKSNRETRVVLRETVRGRDVYIVQTGTKDVNNDVVEALIMIYTCKTNDARSTTLVMPYLPYCKQSKMSRRGSIVCHLIAQMLCQAGINQLITLDLRSKEIQGFFKIPVDNLRASPFLLQAIQENIEDYRKAVVVARSPMAVARATSYADRLRVPVAVIHGEAKDAPEDSDGRNSPPPAQSEGIKSYRKGVEFLPRLAPKAKPPMDLVGDVAGSVAIMVEDLIDDVAPFIAAATLLKEKGASKIYVVVTHGLLSSDAPKKLEESEIDEVFVTNSIPHEAQKSQCRKIKTVDVSMLIAEAIRRIRNKESMSYLFKDIPKDD